MSRWLKVREREFKFSKAYVSRAKLTRLILTLRYERFRMAREWKGKTVPEVLLSGHHGDIKTWQREQAEMVTRDRRPDLWARYLERS